MAQAAAFLAVVCVAVMVTPAAAQSQPDLVQCRTMAGNVTKCIMKLGGSFNATAMAEPTTPECCGQIKDAVSSQMECLCGVYLGFKNYTSDTPSPFDNSLKDCSITTNFPSACKKVEKQLQDAGFIDGGSGNKNSGSGSGKDTGAAGKTATAGVFGIVLVTVVTMFF